MVQVGNTTNPVIETLHTITCSDSPTAKYCGRSIATSAGGIGVAASGPTTASVVSVNTAVAQQLSFSLQQSTNVATPILLRAYAVATYGE